MNEEIIFPDDARAAKLVDVPVWKSRKGNYFLTEQSARYDGATHHKCELCEKPQERPYVFCAEHLKESRDKKFYAYEVVEWDEETPLCLFDTDQCFYSHDDAGEYAFEHGLKLEDLQLVLCKPVKLKQIDEDYFADELPDDYNLAQVSSTLIEKLNEVNQFISTLPPASWREGNKRVILKEEVET